MRRAPRGSVALVLALVVLTCAASVAWSPRPAIGAATPQPPTLARSPSLRQDQPTVYTALGDSIATGIWSAAGYVDRFAARIRAEVDPDLQVNNLAVNGWTTSDLLNALRTNEAYRSAVRDADVVTISIGGNDLLQARVRFLTGACGGENNDACLRATTDHILANWNAILDEVQEIVGPRPTAIRVMDIYNPAVAADTERLEQFKPYLDEVNAGLCGSAEARGIPCAHVYAAFNGPDGTEDPALRSLLAFDHLHPSDRGHALIAELLGDLTLSSVR